MLNSEVYTWHVVQAHCLFPACEKVAGVRWINIPRYRRVPAETLIMASHFAHPIISHNHYAVYMHSNDSKGATPIRLVILVETIKPQMFMQAKWFSSKFEF